jgi:nucleoside-diphosphate-sugar epimerase
MEAAESVVYIATERDLSYIVQICRPTHVLHLAAQAGVRYAAMNPLSYIDSNVRGTSVLLEAIRKQYPMPLLVYASSSSVYGRNTEVCSLNARMQACSIQIV